MNDTNQIKAMDVLDDEQNAFDAIAVKQIKFDYCNFFKHLFCFTFFVKAYS